MVEEDSVHREEPITADGQIGLADGLDPSDPVLAQGETLQLTAMGAWSNFEQADVTNDAVWESDNESVATVEPGGMLTAGSTAGTALITATLDGVVGFATVTVTESSP